MGSRLANEILLERIQRIEEMISLLGAKLGECIRRLNNDEGTAQDSRIDEFVVRENGQRVGL